MTPNAQPDFDPSSPATLLLGTCPALRVNLSKEPSLVVAVTQSTPNTRNSIQCPGTSVAARQPDPARQFSLPSLVWAQLVLPSLSGGSTRTVRVCPTLRSPAHSRVEFSSGLTGILLGPKHTLIPQGSLKTGLIIAGVMRSV